ncbi:MAG: hypothetical protein AAFP86_00465 [Planctomycetota bacterium]
MIDLTLALVAVALPQSSVDPGMIQRALPVKNAGTYHVATGTITRPGLAARALEPDVIYANTAETRYFSPLTGTTYDEGRIPGTSNAGEFTPGTNRDDYVISGFRFSYCDLDITPMLAGFEFQFYSSYAPCTPPAGSADATIQILGLPSGGCWTFDVDLSGGSEFLLVADGGDAAPGFDDDLELDSFGWSWRNLNDTSFAAGLIISGDPQSTDPGYVNASAGIGSPATPASAGTGTYYGPDSLCPPGSTGLGTQDFFYVEGGSGVDGCLFFGGYEGAACGEPEPVIGGIPRIFGSFSMEISSTPSFGEDIGTNFCGANANSTGLPGTLSAGGSATIGNDDVTLTAACLPTEQFGIFIHSFDVPNAGFPSGDGLLCLDPLGSFGIGRFDGAGQVKNSGLDGRVDFSTSMGEWSTGGLPTSVGVMAAMAGQTSSFQFWHRDEVDDVQSFNLTEGVAVTWQ